MAQLEASPGHFDDRGNGKIRQIGDEVQPVPYAVCAVSLDLGELDPPTPHKSMHAAASPQGAAGRALPDRQRRPLGGDAESGAEEA
ncbi:hypothetical protein LPB72_14680 [Hydrogenophaga crassostreae]|uniref:Uncharacterized protein n=1 Tax=Hydrogenophaga crassostreae TaxID=1763535 RepID=A0A167HGG2_9BURK|nr:hypothetical protein LPB072_04430 [Hydrogenophaga crassostreae]OAD41155.1 hypothetical protein LPB72_14680 [Hydrogenophaga crassostreae]